MQQYGVLSALVTEADENNMLKARQHEIIYLPLPRGSNFMNVDLGHRIRIRRTVLKMTQDELAGKLGISQNHLSNMEKGNRTISGEMLDQIAVALRCRPEDLLNEKRRLA